MRIRPQECSELFTLNRSRHSGCLQQGSPTRGSADRNARARLTFRYAEQGPQGLLSGKKVYIPMASGGTEVGRSIDFATPWLKFVPGFLGITDIEAIAADCGMLRGAAARQEAAARTDEALARAWPSRAAA